MTIALPAFCQANAPEQLSPGAAQHILDRLNAIEKQNELLIKEVRELRQELSASQIAPETEERIEAAEQRTKEQAQTKVSASQRFPISLTGMFLFDANETRGAGKAGLYGAGVTGTGATVRQSIIGLEFYGPHLPGDGQTHGSLAMDFYSGTQDSVLRIRRGVVSFDWRRRSIVFGQDKPLIAPWQPMSFARVGIPPLSGAGNLWLWLPQVRYEERIPMGAGTELKAQAAIVQTNENYGSASYVAGAIAPARPGLEARLEVQRSWNDQPRLNVGLGVHTSNSHVLGQSVPSRVVSVDVKYALSRWVQFSGSVLHGENFANLGGLGPGVRVGEYESTAVRASAGWVQAAIPLTSRLTLDIYGGRQLNTARDINTRDPFRSLIYAGNILYRIAPNVVLGFEGGQNRVSYLNALPYSAARYDATVAYLF